MSTKPTQPDAQAQDGLDVSSMLEQYEETPIVPSDKSPEASSPVTAPVKEQTEISADDFAAAPPAPAERAPTRSRGSRPMSRSGNRSGGRGPMRSSRPMSRPGSRPAPRQQKQDIENMDEAALGMEEPQGSPDQMNDKLKEDLKMSYEAKGILDITFGGYGFLRQDYAINPDKDIYVSTSQIRRFWLRRGDEVEGLARPAKEGERFHSMLLIKKINGQEITEDESRNRRQFDQLTSLHPNRQIKLEFDPEILSTRIADLISPIGFGQRALIVSQPKSGKTTFLKEIAQGITANHPDAHLMAILIGERPEEVTEIKRFIKGEVAASHFDESPRQQVKVANLALDRARRLVEMGKDVIILLDSITRLARAFNLSVQNSGRSLSGGVDPQALFPAKKFLGAARNCEEGGSLTIIGTALVGTESRMDDLIYEEFKGTGNMEIHLNRKFAERRIFPAIDIEKSGTRHEELLFDAGTMRKINTLHRMLGLMNGEERLVALTEKLLKTKNNEEFLGSFAQGK